MGLGVRGGHGVDGDGGHTHEERLYISSVLPRTRLEARSMKMRGTLACLSFSISLERMS